MTLIISFGKGTHDLSLILDALWNRGLGPRMQFAKGTHAKRKPRASGANVQEFFNGLIPDTGYSFGGFTIEKVRENGKITAIYIR